MILESCGRFYLYVRAAFNFSITRRENGKTANDGCSKVCICTRKGRVLENISIVCIQVGTRLFGKQNGEVADGHVKTDRLNKSGLDFK